MSFLDSLENNLKAMEGRDAAGLDDRRRRESEREASRASAPWAELLRKSSFSSALMQQATRAGFRMRTKVNLVWLDTTLRLEARGHRLELRPTPTGVDAVFLHQAKETKRHPVDLNADPAPLVAEWMPVLEEQKKQDDELIASSQEFD